MPHARVDISHLTPPPDARPACLADTDAALAKMKLNWRTALIIAELEHEIEALAQGRHHRKLLKVGPIRGGVPGSSAARASGAYVRMPGALCWKQGSCPCGLAEHVPPLCCPPLTLQELLNKKDMVGAEGWRRNAWPGQRDCVLSSGACRHVQRACAA